MKKGTRELSLIGTGDAAFTEEPATPDAALTAGFSPA